MRLLRSFFQLAVAFALITACSTPADPSPSTPADAGPLEFTAKTLQGADLSGTSLAGKPAVLWFWAPWCSTCQAEAPSVARAAQQHPQVTFLGVSALDQLPAMKQFVATYRLDGFTHLADTDTWVWRHFGITQQPAFAFLAPNGSVQVVKGTLSEQDLAQRLTTLSRA